MDNQDLFWLAGLLEGEGSFLKPPPSEPNRPRISLEMIDEDTIQKVNSLFGLRYYTRNNNKRNENWKPSFRTVLRGKHAVEMMYLLYPLMSERRKEQIENVIGKNLNSCWNEPSQFWFFWLAGLLEGEGSFQKSVPTKKNQPQIQLNMTDRDVILRAASLMGVNPSRPYKTNGANDRYKPRSFAFLRGKYAIEMMKQLYPFMSLRRQKQIEIVIASYQPTGQIRGERHPQSKLTSTQVHEIKQRLKNGEKLTSLAQEFAVDKGLIWQIKAGRVWQHIE